MEATQFFNFALAMFTVHWLVTVPTVVAAFFVGYKLMPTLAVWAIIALVILCGSLMPQVPGAARQSEVLVYAVLPILVPIFVLVPYALGCLFRLVRDKIAQTG